jgi:iron complex transport system substrate-binding protein
LLSVLVLAVTACTDGDAIQVPPLESEGPAFPFSFTDASGENVTLEAAPQRIVSLSAAVTETLFAIGAGPQLIAADRFSNFPPAARPLATLEYTRPAPEPVLALAPDLVIMVNRQSGQVSQFRAVGLKVVQLEEPAELDAVLDRIELIGRISGHRDEAVEFSGDMRDRIEGLADRIEAVSSPAAAPGTGPLVFYELSPDGFTAAPDSFVGALLLTVKARNVAEGATTPFPQLSMEAIIAADPEVILLADSLGGQSPASVRARPGWQSISAVRNNRVYEVDPDIFNRAGPRIVDALEQLASLLYPGLDAVAPSGR